MVQRVYATKLMGIADDDLQRLEIAEQERAVLIQAERIAEKHGVGTDEVLNRIREIEERIQRWGLEAELRRFARDCGLIEKEARARYEAARAEYGL